MPPRRPQPDPGLSPSEWHTQELLLMREVMRGIGRSLAPALVLREMLHLMSELLGLNRGRIVLADPAGQAHIGKLVFVFSIELLPDGIGMGVYGI